jgi:hypothetical protein
MTPTIAINDIINRRFFCFFIDMYKGIVYQFLSSIMH